MIRVVCPTCRSQFDTHEQYAGQVAACPNCETKITIPAAAPAYAPSGQAPAGVPGPAAGPGAGQARPGKVTAIGVMTLIGGVVAGIVSITLFVYALIVGIATLGIGFLFFFPAIYSLILCIVAIVKGILLLTARPQQRSGPLVTAILQVINIISCDFVNVVLGILILVFQSDPQVRAYYRP